MDTVKLHLQSAPADPFLIQEAQRRPLEGKVTQQGVTAGRHRFTFASDVLSEGTDVQVSLNPLGFFATSKAWLDAQAQTAAEATAQAAQRQRDELDDERRALDRFLARYRLPFAWTVGIKSVLSGLSARSSGDGRRRSTVDHCLVLERFTAGRLSREPGDFLCTTRPGERWVEPASNGTTPSRPVTCPACLARMERLRLSDPLFQEPCP